MANEKSERRVVPFEEAVARIGAGRHIHTIRGGGFAIIGADWDRADILRTMKECGVEEAGGMASAMGHTLVIVNCDGSPLFIEAKPARAALTVATEDRTK